LNLELVEEADTIELVNNLKADLEKLINEKELLEQEIQHLSVRLEEKSNEEKILELAFSEANRLATLTQDEAKHRAIKVVSEAEVKVAEYFSQYKKMENEIEQLENEIQCYSRFNEELMSIQNMENLALYDFKNTPVSIKEISHIKATVYSFMLVAFVNARHFVTFGGKSGPVHAHSWQVQIDAHVPTEKAELVAFARIIDQVKKAMGFYENKVLNEVPGELKLPAAMRSLTGFFPLKERKPILCLKLSKLQSIKGKFIKKLRLQPSMKRKPWKKNN